MKPAKRLVNLVW